MPPGVAVCFSSLFIRLVCMAFLTSSDKALWHLALPMILSRSPFRCWDWSIRRLLVILIVRFIWAAWRLVQRRPAFSYAVAVFTHEHHRADCAGLWCQKSSGISPCAGATFAVGVGGWALIALLRTPIIDLALHIVGGSEAVLEQARRFVAGQAHRRRWRIWYYLVGYSACNMPVLQ